jgi:hypothetical protein
VATRPRSSVFQNWGEQNKKLVPVAVLAVFVVIGVLLLSATRAATPFLSLEPENGTLAGTASKVTDTIASGGSAIKFGSAQTGTCAGAANTPGGADPWGGCWPGPATGVDMSQCPGGLTASGSLNITTAGTTISCKNITGRVDTNAANITIKNSKIHDAFSGSDNNLPTVWARGGRLTIFNTEMYRTGVTALGGDNFTAYNMNIHDMSTDGVKFGDNVEVHDIYFHDWTPGLAYNELGDTNDTGNHSDGGQLQSGNSNVIFRHNYVDAILKPGYTPLGDGNYVNSALFLAPDLGPNGTGPITIDKNIFNSAAFYPVSFLDGNNGQYHQKGYSVTSNRFVRNSGNSSPYRNNEPVANFTAWCGNVYNDNGAAITGPISTPAACSSP